MERGQQSVCGDAGQASQESARGFSSSVSANQLPLPCPYTFLPLIVRLLYIELLEISP